MDSKEPRTPTSTQVTLREINRDNRASIKALRVAAGQEDYVDDVSESLAEAAATPTARPWYRAVYADEVPVGFLMIGDNVPPGNQNIPWRYYLWRLLIDERYQGRGYGRAALDRLVEYLKTRPDAEMLVASVVPGHGSPLGFYLRYGFEPTRQMFDDEQVLQLRLATVPRNSGPRMRRLFLLRHAKSSWDDPELVDHDRPLAARGRRAVKLIAEHLARERVTPKLVLCSSARRTRETLELIAPVLGDGITVRIERELYAASEQRLLERLRAVEDRVESLMLIGHNPGVEQLALTLAGSGENIARVRRKYPTGALVTLEFSGRWSELRPGSAKLTAFITPRQLAKR